MSADGTQYDASYYEGNRQAGDRVALFFYHRVAAAAVRSGRVLDYGCGTGHLVKRWRGGYEAWAFDVSPHARESTRSVAPAAQVCDDPSDLPRGAFDLVTCLHVLEHVDAPAELLRLFHDLLGPGGTLLYVVPNKSGWGHRIKREQWVGYRDPTHVSLHTADEWLALTREAGLDISRAGSDGLWDMPYFARPPAWLQKLLLYPLPALQILLGRLLWPRNWGEALVVLANRPAA